MRNFHHCVLVQSYVKRQKSRSYEPRPAPHIFLSNGFLPMNFVTADNGQVLFKEIAVRIVFVPHSMEAEKERR